MEPIIRFSGADILNGENVVIYGLDMAIHPGDFVYIVGKVGTGKTSIIRTMTATYRCCAAAWASFSRISSC